MLNSLVHRLHEKQQDSTYQDLKSRAAGTTCEVVPLQDEGEKYQCSRHYFGMYGVWSLSVLIGSAGILFEESSFR